MPFTWGDKKTAIASAANAPPVTPEDEAKKQEEKEAKDQERNRRRTRRRRVGWFIGGTALAALATSVKVFRPTHYGIVERLGKYNRTLTPGLNFIWPFRLERLHLINAQMQPHIMEPQLVITKDRATTHVNSMVLYRVVDPVKALYQMEDYQRDYPKVLTSAVRNVVGQFTLQETTAHRKDMINPKFFEEVATIGRQCGIEANTAEVLEIRVDAAIQRAMDEVLKAENDEKASEHEAKAANIRAKGHKEAEIRRAEGQAMAIRTVNTAITQTLSSAAFQFRQLEAGQAALQNSGTKWVIASDHPLYRTLFPLVKVAMDGPSDLPALPPGPATGPPPVDGDEAPRVSADPAPPGPAGSDTGLRIAATATGSASGPSGAGPSTGGANQKQNAQGATAPPFWPGLVPPMQQPTARQQATAAMDAGQNTSRSLADLGGDLLSHVLKNPAVVATGDRLVQQARHAFDDSRGRRYGA